MFVELIGPAGSGKTTVARLLDAPLAAAGIAACSFAELDRLNRQFGEHSLKPLGFRRVFVLAPLYWRHPRIAFGLLAIAVAHGPPFRKRLRRARRVLGHFLFMLRLEERGEERVLVMHEGFLQRLWSVVIESKELRLEGVIRSVLADYHALLRPVAIALEVDDEVAAARVFARNSRGRFNLGSSGERKAEFPRWLDYRRRLLALLPADAIAGSVDAAGTPESTARATAALISRAADARRGTAA